MATGEVTFQRRCQQCGWQDSRAVSSRDSLYPQRCDPAPACRSCGSNNVCESRPLPPATSELIDEWLANSDGFIGDPTGQDVALTIWLTIPVRLALFERSDVDPDKRLELFASLVDDFEVLQEQVETAGAELKSNEMIMRIIDCFAANFAFLRDEQQKREFGFGMTFDDEILPLVKDHLASR